MRCCMYSALPRSSRAQLKHHISDTRCDVNCARGEIVYTWFPHDLHFKCSWLQVPLHLFLTYRQERVGCVTEKPSWSSSFKFPIFSGCFARMLRGKLRRGVLISHSCPGKLGFPSVCPITSLTFDRKPKWLIREQFRFDCLWRESKYQQVARGMKS